MSNIYDVILETPVGKRYGKMNVSIHDKNISGILHILKGAELFEGEIEDNGYCRIQGHLSTLMHRFPYYATGIIKDQLELKLICDKECFRLVGEQSV